uniref:Transcriptional elongation regulator MINIYO n=1 Tax=Oryza rufipogon TaxID=4529 RepID=A0A0E0PZF7_ORYRU
MDDAAERRRRQQQQQPGAAHPARRKVVEEPFDPSPPPAAAVAPPSSRLVGAIVEKGFSSGAAAAAPSSAPSPTVLPFPVARHRSHGPHWKPAARDAAMAEGEGEEEEGMDVDETDYQPVAAAAGPVKRKEKKGMDFSRWREFVADDAPPKRRQAKPLQPKKQTAQKIDTGVVAATTGGTAQEKRSGGIGMQLEVGNGKEELGGAALMSDVAPRKPMKQVDARDDVRNVELRGEGMESDNGEPSLTAEINAENMARLAGMSAGEIAEAQAEILNRMDPAFVEMLKRRGKEKSGSRKDGGKGKGGGISGPGKISKAMPGEWLSAGEHSGHTWKAWSERVERIRSCRFTLEGDILGFQSCQEQQHGKKAHVETVGERDFLRTEGDPAAVGYTINEAVALSRSMVPGQRVLALQLLALILNRALQNLHKTDLIDNFKESNDDDKFNDWQAVWAYAIGPEPELVLSLRMSLDDNHDSVVLTCAKVINAMLSYEMNEMYFDVLEKVVDQGKDICTAPVFRSKPDQNGGFLEGGFWKYNTKPSNILPHYGENDEEEGDEKHTIQDDVVVSGQDVAAGLVRMGILPRICFLLEMDPHPILEDNLVSILLGLARHSPQSADAILNCPRLVQSVVKLLVKQGSMEIHSSQIKGVNLLKVLSKYNRQTCFNFVNTGVFHQAMWHWYRKAYTLEDWIRSGKEHCKLTSALMVEQLRFWRTCISYGFCITHFTDFFPILCLWLSPSMFQKLSESNVVAEFSSIATESYLVLGALAQRLPLLHSVEQLSKQDMGLSGIQVETWSWSHAVPMVDLALSWLCLNDIPYVCLLISGQSKNILEGSYFALVISSVLGMLDSILERISPDSTHDGKSYCLPWIPDFVPKIGLGVITNGFFNFLDDNAVELEQHTSFHGSSLVQGLFHLRSQGNVDTSLCSISCFQRLLQLSCSIDRVIQNATTNCTEHLKESKTGIAGRILEQEMFGRGGPAPGVGFGWGAYGGGFWSLNFLLAQLDSHFVLELMKILSTGPEGLVTVNKSVNPIVQEGNNVTDSVAITSERISSVLSVSLMAGPGQISTLEKAFDILFHPSVLKFLKSSVLDSHMKLAKAFEWDITEDEYLHFSSVLNSHFRSRWLVIKKKHSDEFTRNNNGTNVPKIPETLETIQEETELAEAVNPPCSVLAVEWAHQRLPLPVHWILSAVCCIDDPKANLSTSYAVDVSKAGLFFLLGLEAISAAPCLHAPLVWKMHALSASIRSSMDLLLEDRSRDIFHALQELYGLHLDRLCQKYDSAHSVKKEGSASVDEEKVTRTEVLRFQEKIHANYTTFVESLIEQFAAVSYGDALFGRQVAIYLHRSVEPTIRLAAWNALSNAYVLELLPPLDKCVGDVQGYLEPLEDDEGILESYAKSWTSGALDKAFQRDAMSFTVARHHLSGFVFQCSGSGKVRNKLVKSLIRCYGQKRHHEDMLKGFVLQGIAQDSQRNDEVSRRFEIMKDACEMNSSLLAEVRRLKTSIDR